MKRTTSKVAKTKTTYYSLPAKIQYLFIVTIFAAYLLESGYTAYSVYFGLDDAIASEVAYMGVYFLVPVAGLIVAYAMNPRSLRRLSRLFESLLLTLAGYVAWSAASSVVYRFIADNTDISGYDAYFYWSSAAFVVFFALGLAFLRRRGIWS